MNTIHYLIIRESTEHLPKVLADPKSYVTRCVRESDEGITKADSRRETGSRGKEEKGVYFEGGTAAARGQRKCLMRRKMKLIPVKVVGTWACDS